MSAAIAIIIRVLSLFGVSLSPFAAGALLTASVVAAGGLVALHLYDAGASSAEAKCETAALESKLEAAMRDREAARAALGDARLRSAAVERQASEEQERTAAYVTKLEKQASGVCALNDDDLRGMRATPGGEGAARKGASAGAGFLDAARAGAAFVRRR